MKICLPFPGDSIGGSHVSAILTMKLLQERGHEFIVLLHQEGVVADWLKSQDVAYEIAPTGPRLPRKGHSLIRNMLRTSSSIPSLVRWLRDRQVDIVYTNDGRMTTTWALPTRLSRKKFLVHHRLADMGKYVRRGASLAHRIITISQFNHARLPGKLRSKATVIPNPVAMPTMSRDGARQAMRAFLKLPADAELVGFIGKIKQQKRPLLFLDVAAKLRTPGRYFPMFGDRNDTETWNAVHQRIKELKLEDVVHLAGFIDDLPNVVGGLDLLIAPQVDEGFGRNVAEAMAAGVPVVAARSGAHPEFILQDETGLLVPTDDANLLLESADSLLGDPVKSAAIALKAQDFIRERHATECFGNAFAAVVDELATRHR